MKKLLITYGTTEGQTEKIASFIRDVLRDLGHDVELHDVTDMRDTIPAGYDGVIVGASIHMGKHDKHVVEFVRKNQDALARLRSAFFSVSLAAHGDTAEAEGYVDQFEEETGWRPDKVALFGGALLYTQYGFIKRHMMKKIAGDKPGNLGTDLSRDYVYTEWDGVKRFAGGLRNGSRLNRRPARRLRNDWREGIEPGCRSRSARYGCSVDLGGRLPYSVPLVEPDVPGIPVVRPSLGMTARKCGIQRRSNSRRTFLRYTRRTSSSAAHYVRLYRRLGQPDQARTGTSGGSLNDNRDARPTFSSVSA